MRSRNQLKFFLAIFVTIISTFHAAQKRRITTWKPVAAGILPTTDEGNYILGQQTCIDIKNEGMYDYFAGMIDPEDHGSSIKAALREFSEECRWPENLSPCGDSLRKTLDAITILATKNASGHNTFGVMYRVKISEVAKNTIFEQFPASYSEKLKERNTFWQYIRHQLNWQPMNAYLEKDRLAQVDKDFKLVKTSKMSVYGSYLPQRSIVKTTLEGLKSILRLLKNRFYYVQNKIYGTAIIKVRPILGFLLDASKKENQFVPALDSDRIQGPSNSGVHIPVYICATEKIRRWIGNEYRPTTLTAEEKKSLYDIVKKDLENFFPK